MNIWKSEKVKDISADDLLTVLGAVGAAMAAGVAAAPSDSRGGTALVIVAGIGAAAATGVAAYFRFRKAA